MMAKLNNAHAPNSSSSTSEQRSEWQEMREARKELVALLQGNEDWQQVKQLLEHIKQKGFTGVNQAIAFSVRIQEQLRAKIEAGEMEYVTRGQEGEIFKVAVDLDGEIKEFIVIKQRYDQSHVHHEAKMFEQAAFLLNKTSPI